MEQPTQPVVHFAHANGFPAGAYNYLFEHLPSDWTLLAMDKFGHDKRFPISENWRLQIDELAQFLGQELPNDTSVYLVGHSFGALVSYMTACVHPERVKGLILLDPPALTGQNSMMFRLAKKTSLIDKITPAGLTKIRRTTWAKSDDLHKYFASKTLFKDFHPRCIADYVDSATDHSGDYIRLTFDKDVEARVFRHLPHNLSRFAGKLKCPGVLVTGDTTAVCTPARRKGFIKANKLVHAELPGGHMFPLENPVKTAQWITQQIQYWEQERVDQKAG